MQSQEQLIHLDNGHTTAHYRIRFQDCNPRYHVHLHRLMDLAQDSDDHNCGLFDSKSEDLRARHLLDPSCKHRFFYRRTSEGGRYADCRYVDAGTRGIRLFAKIATIATPWMKRLFRIGVVDWIFCTLTITAASPPSVIDLDKIASVSDDAVGNMAKIRAWPLCSTILIKAW